MRKWLIVVAIITFIIIVAFVGVSKVEAPEKNSNVTARNELVKKDIIDNTNINVKNKNIIENDLENNNLSKEDIEFDSDKMKVKAGYSSKYEKDETDRGNAGLDIVIKEGKPYLSTDITNEAYKLLFPKITKTIKEQEIIGFDKKVIEVKFAFIGNGDPVPIILFLMEDGTVEYIPSDKMLNNRKYESFGKIDELSNIVKFANVILSEVNEDGENLGGIVTIVAIDETGYSYDLSQIKQIEDVL